MWSVLPLVKNYDELNYEELKYECLINISLLHGKWIVKLRSLVLCGKICNVIGWHCLISKFMQGL